MKRYAYAFLTGLLIAGTVFLLLRMKPIKTMGQPLEPDAEIILVGEEKSDCILIHSKEFNAMIDTGLAVQADDILELCRDRGIKNLDFLILSHFDKDHVGGAADILRELTVESIYVPDYKGEGEDYERFLTAAKEQNVTVTIIRKNTSFNMGEMQFLLIPGQKSAYEKVNNYSLVTAMEYEGTSFLFCGDIEAERIEEMLSYENRSFSFLKVPHHGIHTDGLTELTEKFSPQVLLVTGLHDMFSADLKEYAENKDIPSYFVEDGTITIVIQEENVSLFQ